MEVIGRSFSVLCLTPSLSARRRFCTTLAKKKDDVQDNNESQQQSFLPLKVSKSDLARAAIGVFGLGFIDAGLVTLLVNFVLFQFIITILILHDMPMV